MVGTADGKPTWRASGSKSHNQLHQSVYPLSPCFRFFTCKVEGTEVSLHRSSILGIRHTALGNAQNGGHVGSVMHAEVFKLSGFQCGTGEEEDNLEAQETMVMFQAPTKDYET